MQDAKEEVRSRLNIEDVISEYVELKRAGRNFKGLSPFTGEKTASFFVSPDKQIWHDFSSNKGGDIFSFVMEVEGLDFRGALESLARKAGVDLSLYQSAGSQRIAARKKRSIEANKLAAQYYQTCLVKNASALEYVFKKRGLSKDIVTEFKIGYAPDSGDALVNFLVKRGLNARELSDAGLTNRYGKDLFRGRMMVPLMDQSGQVIGFTGRIIRDIEGAPKYLNTPQTLLYDKSRHVFGLSQAKATIRSSDQAVIVEGNLDVVTSHQFGVKEVVATAGTALTEHHLRALSRLTGNIRLAFDADKAGLAATERAISIASELGVRLTIVSVPAAIAKDPDELIRHDVKEWQRVIAAAEPAVDWLFQQYSAREDISSAAGKRAFTTAALGVVRRLADPIEQDHYEQKIAGMVGSSREAVHQKLISHGEKSVKRPLKTAPHVAAAPDAYTREDAVLALALSDPKVRELFAQYDTEIFADEARQAVVRFIEANPTETVVDTPKSLKSHDTYVKILLLKAEMRYADWDAPHRYYEAAELLRRITTEHMKQQKNYLQTELRAAEETHSDKKVQEILRKINELDKEIRRGR
ncbi:MAG TPA: DNA primase [Candidatus Saccharimonadaceae bacterium]|nr:DNA primase [Candidatus Saccharimonadaceae bacterium]